jgi:hypothetical protein
VEQARVRCMGATRAASLFAALSLVAASARAIDDGGDLEAVRRRGVLHHLGVPHANFVTGGGDGLDVERMRRFAQRAPAYFRELFAGPF